MTGFTVSCIEVDFPFEPGRRVELMLQVGALCPEWLLWLADRRTELAPQLSLQ